MQENQKATITLEMCEQKSSFNVDPKVYAKHLYFLINSHLNEATQIQEE